MTSISCSTSSPSISFSSGDGSDDYDVRANENYGFMNSERMEKSMTNLNVNLVAVTRIFESLGESHMQYSAHMTKEQEEFNMKFTAQQELLLEEIKLLHIEHAELRKKMRGGF